MELPQRIAERKGEVLLFAVTPPRATVSPERAREIADITLQRLEPLELDGLLLYDIDDESDRNPETRPFPFLPTMDPASWLTQHLTAWNKPVVVYRAVGKYPEADLRSWLDTQDPARLLSVFVGAASRDTQPATSLTRAQELRAEVMPDLLLGGVAIPERHTPRGEEHLRLIAKQESGCSFFVTQVVYDINAAKDLVSDYRYECLARGLSPVPIVFTFLGLRLYEDTRLPQVARRPRSSLDRERTQARGRHARRFPSAGPGDSPRAHCILQATRCPLRAQRGKRLHPSF